MFISAITTQVRVEFNKTYEFDDQNAASHRRFVDLQFMHRQILNAVEKNIVDEIYISADLQMIHVH
jgi:hypothetical protein